MASVGPAVQLSFSVQPGTVTAGTVIAPALQVAVQDSAGNVVTSSTTSITVLIKPGTGTSGAQLRGTLTASAVNGVATFATLSVDLAGTGYVLLAGAPGFLHVASVAFNVTAVSAARLSFSVQPANTLAGATLTPAAQVSVLDGTGKVMTSSTASITVALTSGTGTAGARLLGATTVSAVNGVATFATLRVDSAGSGYTLTASASGLSGATSSLFKVSAASAVRLGYAIQPRSTAAGAVIAPAVRVTVLDSVGNVVTTSTAGITVLIKPGTGTTGARLLGTTTASAVNGVATFATLSVDLAGIGYVLLAGAPSFLHVPSVAFNVTAVGVTRLSYSVQPANTTAGATLTPAPQVAVLDGSGNVVTSSTASITVALTSGTGTAGARLGGTTTVSAVNGVATFATLHVDSAGSGYTLTASAAGLSSATSAAFTVGSAGIRTYTTSFPLTENPVSQGGNWINGATVGLDWTNVSTTPGLAIGHQVGPSYTDATAILTGAWGPNQRATATVYSVSPNDACSQEVELRLRSALSARVSRGYEISFKVSQSSAAYLIIVRWNGALGDFTYLFNQSGAQYGVKTGDVVSARIVGSVITAYKNGVQMGQANDGTFATGAPGMGFNLESAPAGCAGTNSNYGYTSYTATDANGP
jgi:hypothetical protein